MIDDGSGNWMDPTSGDTSDSSLGSSSDFVGGGGETDYGSGAGGTYGSSANYGSALGGLTPSLLGGTGSGVSVSGVSRSSRQSKSAAARAAGYSVPYRHVNPLNPKALRRAISRVSRFEGFAKRVLKITSPKHHVAGIKRHRRRRRSW